MRETLLLSRFIAPGSFGRYALVSCFGMKTMKLAIIITLAITSLAPQTNGIAYAPNWQIYSPPNKSFDVELPAPLRRVMSFEGERGANLVPDQNIGWATCYAGIETIPEESRFGIVVVNGKARTKFLRSQNLKKYLEYLSRLFIGDDDEAQFMRAPIVVNRNRLTGMEYIYVKEDTLNNVTLHTRGRIFDTGYKTYVLVFIGKNVEELTSPDAERFLSSFRLRNKNR
jgi:hypothetical protein